jgi:hypothetical protein
MNLEELQSSIGKRVSVKTNSGVICGILQFAGKNEFLPSWGFQLTVGGMPIQNVDPNNVSLAIERPLIRKKEVSTEQIDNLFNEAKEKFGSTLQKLSE